VPYWATLPVAGAVCFRFGFLMGLPALRLGGHYLALATFALALAVPQLLKYKAIEGWTGGVQGIVLDKPEPPFTFRSSASRSTPTAGCTSSRSRCVADVPARLEPAARPGRPGAGGDPRPPHRRQAMGINLRCSSR
jgi:hypothetical protein